MQAASNGFTVPYGDEGSAGPLDTRYDSGTPSEGCNDNRSAAKD